MIKKLIVILPLLGLGCTPAKPPVSIQSCDKIYSHILDLAAENAVETDPDYPSIEMLISIGALDESVIDAAENGMRPKIDAFYQKRGTTKQFYSFCTEHMTEQQVACALKTNSLDEINVCTEKTTR